MGLYGTLDRIPYQMASIMSVSGFKVQKWMKKLQSAKPTASVKLCCCDERWKWLNLGRIVLLVCFLIDASQSAFLTVTSNSHRPCTDMITVVIWGLSCMFGLWGHNDEGGSGLHHHYWHGTLAWVRGHLFQRTEVCMACHWGGKSTPSVSQTRVKLVVPGKSAYSVILEETSFPALHGTLGKVGGHHSKNWGMWSMSQTSNYTHTHTRNSTITTMLHWEKRAAILVKGKRGGYQSWQMKVALLPWSLRTQHYCSEITRCFSCELMQSQKTHWGWKIESLYVSRYWKSKLYSDTSKEQCVSNTRQIACGCVWVFHT